MTGIVQKCPESYSGATDKRLKCKEKVQHRMLFPHSLWSDCVFDENQGLKLN